MADTIGVKIGVDGEREFKQALSNINTQMRVLGSEMKLVESQFSNQDKSVQALTARNAALQKSIEGQKQKIELLEKALKNSASSFGVNDKRTLAWQQKLNEAKAALNKMEREVEENNQALNQSEKEFKEAGKQADNYGDEVKKSGDKSKAAGEALQGLGTACKAVGVAIAAAAAAVSAAAIAAGKALIQMTREGAEYADSVLTESQVTGIATDKLQEYMYAAELVDVSVETLTGSMAKNIKSMKSAADGSSAYANAYEQLGVSVTNADGSLRDSNEVYWELIDALGTVENETERDALAMQLLGRSAQDLNPLIIAGSERMAELGEEARNAGYVLSGDLLEAYGAYDDAVQRFNNGTKAAKNALGTILLPILTELSNEGVNLLGEFSNAVLDCGGDLSKLSDVVDEMLPEVLNVLNKYIPIILSLIASVVGSIGKALIDNLQVIVGSVTDILTNLLSYLVSALPEIVDVLVGVIKTLVGAILDNMPLLLSAVKEIVVGIINSLSNVGGDFASIVVDVFSQLASTITDLFPVILDAVISCVANLANNYESALSVLLEKTIDIIEKLVGTILDHLPSFVEAALTIIKGIVNALLNSLPQLISSIGRMISQIIKTILSFIPNIIGAVLDIVRAIVEALPEIIDSIIGMIDEILSGVISAVIEALPSIVNAVFALVLGIIDALPDIITMIVTMIPEIIINVINTLINSLPELIACVMEIVEGVLEHLPEIIMALVSAIPQIITAIVQSLFEGIPRIVDVGANLVKGLWEGIKSMITWLWNKVSDWCSSLWNGIKDFFGIHSPSTRFAEIGENLGLGLGEGFVDTMKGVEDDIEKAIPTDFDIDAKAHVKSVAYDNNNEISRIGNAVSSAVQATGVGQSNIDSAKEQISLLRQQNSLLRIIVEKEFSIFIGDDEIGRANSRYEEKRGITVNEGGFKNAY